MFFNKALLKRAFKETLEEYFQKTCLNGFRLMFYIRRRKYQRCFWLICILFGCIFAGYVSFIIVTSFIQKPTVTALASFKRPIFGKEFPGVAICSANKISRIRAEAFAKELFNRTGRPQDYWLQKIWLFAGHYEDGTNDLDVSIEFELELRKALGEKYDIALLLKRLAPSCEEIILLCRYARVEQNCSEIFKMVATVVGHCCFFNRREEHVQKNFRRAYYINGVGYRHGLTVILNASTNDYYYKGRSMNGFLVQIFEPHNFPDTSLGGVREILVGPGRDVRIELLLVSQSADSRARKFSYSKRRCFFEDESLGDEELAYSQQECLSKCRVHSQINTCECAPYFMPQEFLQGINNVTICSLIDLECMSAFYVVWRSYRPKELDGAEVIQHESMSCSECYPLCNFDHYYYEKENFQLRKTLYDRKNRKFHNYLKNNTTDRNLVRVFFREPYAIQYEQKVLFNWFQIMSNIGGVLGISMGCSIIGSFEILHFFVYRFTVNFINLRKIQNKA